MLFLSRFLALAVIPIAVSGFSIPNQENRATKTARFASADDANLDKEVSRRVALVTAAALAAGAVSVPAAYAAYADVPTQRSVGASTIKDAIRLSKLELLVGDLEKKNLETVNSNGAPEKHIPQVTVDPAKSSDYFNVKVTIPHVMDSEKPHYIQYVWLKDMKKGNVMAVKAFQATDAAPPSLTATNLKAGMKVKPLLFCNLHGLWEGETMRL
jgi:desulfoferrodoxin-like iron-binding protein